MDPNSARTQDAVPARRRRRPAFVLVYAAFLALLAEGGSYLGLSILAGHAVSAGEIGAQMARVGGLEDVPTAGFDQGTGRIVHPYLGYLSRSWIDDGADLVRLESPAFYEPDSPIFDRSPDTVVIGVAGGSVAGGFVYDGGVRELAGLLRDDARFAGKRFRFVSLTTGGWKQPQQLMALGFLLALGGRVDLLIELDGFNEIALHELENQDQGVAPIYPRSWFFMSQRNAVQTELARLEDLHRGRVESARAAARSPLRHLWSFRLWWTWRDGRSARAERTLQDELRGTVREADERTSGELILLGPRARGTDRSERLDELVRIWSECSIQMQRLCRANGIDYLLCLQPNQYVPGSKPLTEEERRKAFNADPQHYQPLVVEGYPRLQAAGAHLRDEEGVRFADLTRIFEDVRETIYVDDCCHINALGNSLVARAIARVILDSTR